jgi:signal transduction histidine kinase
VAPWIVPGPFSSRPRAGRALDATLALVSFAGTIAVATHGMGAVAKHGTDAAAGDGTAVAVTLAAVASWPLVAWRRAPLAVFVITLLGSAALMALGYPGGPPIGATIALYLVALSRDDDHPWTRPLAVIVTVLFAAHFAAFALGHRGSTPLLQIAIGALTWALAWFAGERGRLRRKELAELHQRALRAERDAERERQLAVAEERTRIARDLHDSAAHAVNVIAVQAGAARLHLAGDPARSSAALETIEEVARRTVAEIDQIVHGLREPQSGPRSVEPPAGLAALNSLLDEHRDAGIGVTVDVHGTPRPLGTTVDRAAYRILQEALTNSARHGSGTAAVRVKFADGGLELTVDNPAAADADAAGAARANGGHGLVGMRERAALVGGDLRAGRNNGHVRVQALLPYGANA